MKRARYFLSDHPLVISAMSGDLLKQFPTPFELRERAVAESRRARVLFDAGEFTLAVEWLVKASILSAMAEQIERTVS